MGGELIHGKAIPHGYTKIVIINIKENIKPQFVTQFDDECLVSNSITVWPSCELSL